jgi:hypothetical protein
MLSGSQRGRKIMEEFYEFVAFKCNKGRGFFKKKVSADHVFSVIFEVTPITPKGIDAAQIISVAKAVCKGAGIVCPFIEKM